MPDMIAYSPVVRWKVGERKALYNLSPDVRELMMPIIEPFPGLYARRNGALRGRAARVDAAIGRSVADSWGRSAVIIDCHLLPSWIDRDSPVCSTVGICRAARAAGVRAVPAIRRTSTRALVEVRRHLNERDIGVCVRLELIDLAYRHISRDLERILGELRLPRSSVDLVLDYGQWYFDHPPIVNALSSVGGASGWRSIAFVSGSFPKDLTDVEEGLRTISRPEWTAWTAQSSPSKGAGRFVRFGDFTTQHAIYSEPPEYSNPSVSVRYALQNKWIVSRGQGIEQGSSEQWIGHALLLTGQEYFYGRQYSAGDKYIADRCEPGASTGNFTTWLQASVNHHISVSARSAAAAHARRESGEFGSDFGRFAE
jgi:hypothetical protein